MNLSTLITCSRLAFGPLFILCFVAPFGWTGKLLAVVVAALIEATDLADGMVARRRGEVSDLGRYLDPFADSVSRMSAFLAFLAAGYAAVWMTAIIFYRDILVAYVRIWQMRQGVVQAARLSGKIKAWVQGVGIVVVSMAAFVAALGGMEVHLAQRLSHWVMGAVAVLTGVSGVEYAAGLRGLSPRGRPSAQ